MSESSTSEPIPIPQTRRDWSLLTHAEKEEAWKLKFGNPINPNFPTVISDPAHAKRVFARFLQEKDMSTRAMARRGFLAAEKGGVCEMDELRRRRPELESLPSCQEPVRDFRFLRLWEFNHIVSRAYDPSQFVISGSDCARREWSTVKRHCLEDTVLLCRECHWRVTELEKDAQNIANRTIFGLPNRV